MAYIHGQTCSLSFGTESWEGHVTKIRSKQTLDESQVKVMGQAFANTVTGAYHTIFTVDVAFDDAALIGEWEAGTVAAADFFIGPAASLDKLALASAVVVDMELTGDVEGHVVGTIILAGNSALTYTVA